jgi:hypothetical protein
VKQAAKTWRFKKATLEDAACQAGTPSLKTRRRSSVTSIFPASTICYLSVFKHRVVSFKAASTRRRSLQQAWPNPEVEVALDTSYETR